MLLYYTNLILLLTLDKYYNSNKSVHDVGLISNYVYIMNVVIVFGFYVYVSMMLLPSLLSCLCSFLTIDFWVYQCTQVER